MIGACSANGVLKTILLTMDHVMRIPFVQAQASGDEQECGSLVRLVSEL
jgi:hypothetical protein